MIYIKSWIRRHDGGLTVYYYEGIFLFGFIPLYIKRIQEERLKKNRSAC